MSPFFTPSEFKNEFGISLQTQARMRMKKHQLGDAVPLPFIKIGGKILYKKEQIYAWMDALQANFKEKINEK